MRELGRQRTGRQPPGPVPRHGPRRVEARRRVEPEQVLRRNDRQARHGGESGADQRLGHRLRRRPQKVVDALRGVAVEAAVPAEGRVVVVGAGVRHAVAIVEIRQVWVVRLAVESKLQHAHPRDAEPVLERQHVLGDEAEILGDQRQVAELIEDPAQELFARRVLPGAAARVGGACGHGPVRGERPEVIDPEEIHARKLRAHSREPPREPGALQGLPVVYGIPPQLPHGREVVGRHAADGRRLAGGLQLKQLAMCPGFQ